jgi:hypothetical protein
MVHPGNHVVALDLQSGWEQTYVPPVVVMTPDLDVANVDFGLRALPGSISGQKWHDLDGDAVKEEGEPGLAGWTIFLDANENGTLDEGESFTTTDIDGNYEFTGLSVGDYAVAEVLPAGWRQTTPTMPDLEQLHTSLAANHSAIVSLVPNRYDFLEGDGGYYIVDGGSDMYDTGNRLSTSFNSPIIYTDGAVTDGSFGAESQYFTEKYPGLFLLAATDTDVTYFQITGGTGYNGAGTVDAALLTTTVSGQLFTIFVKRTYGTARPTINHIVILRGDGNGATHQTVADTDSDYHFMSNMAGNKELYYLLVSTTGGQFLPDADVLNVANAFLQNVTLGSDRPQRISVGPGADVENVDFGNLGVQPLLGDYNRDASVDAADYVVWRKTTGTSPIPAYEGADGNGDSAIDEDDQGVWVEHFGESAGTGGGGGGGDGAGAMATTSTFAMSAATAESVDVFLGSSRVAYAELHGGVPAPDVHAALYATSAPGAKSSTDVARKQGSASRSSHDALEVALQTWLGRAADERDTVGDTIENQLACDGDARDQFFNSLDSSFAAIVRDASWVGPTIRSKARLAAPR